MYRFYSPDADFSKPSITVRDNHEIHHIKNVLRLKKGAMFQIFNSQSQEADVVLEHLDEAAMTARVQKVRDKQETDVKIILACAPPKKGKFEWIIEKCTELGVDEIIPLKTQRTEVDFKADKMAAKLSRFKAVAVNASKQSRRVKVPVIHPMTPFKEILEHLPSDGLALFPSLHGHILQITPALQQAGASKAVTILIGPEGDFTPEELALAQQHGCVPVSLGKTVLKVETAAMATVALVRFLMGREIIKGA